MNAELITLSRRPARRFWGWGAADAVLDDGEQAIVKFMVERLGGSYAKPAPPEVGEFDLRAPRLAPPLALASMFSQAPIDRLNHAYGKSYACLLYTSPSPRDGLLSRM